MAHTQSHTHLQQVVWDAKGIAQAQDEAALVCNQHIIHTIDTIPQRGPAE